MQLQHRYVSRTDVGFDKEHILQVRLSPGTGAKSELFRQKLIRHAGIVDVAFAEDEFVRDEGKAHIAYYYQNERLTQYWIKGFFLLPRRDGHSYRNEPAGISGLEMKCR